MGQKTVPTRRVAQHCCFTYIICAQFLDFLEDCSNGQEAFVGVDHVLGCKVSPSEESFLYTHALWCSGLHLEVSNISVR